MKMYDYNSFSEQKTCPLITSKETSAELKHSGLRGGLGACHQSALRLKFGPASRVHTCVSLPLISLFSLCIGTIDYE